jgi:hypothetical protein
MGETVDFAVYQKQLVVLRDLHAFLLRRFSLAIDKYHPLQFEIVALKFSIRLSH